MSAIHLDGHAEVRPPGRARIGVPPRPGRWRLVVKRCLDIVASSLLLLLLAPLMAVVASAIRRHDGGPAIFRQQRVGQHGELFTIYKFRTMVLDASEQLDGLRGRNERIGGPLFKLEQDPRVTRLGRFLRATSIDELPQLVNVLRGSMSLVGPRPALPDEFQRFDVELRTRCRLPQGMTGLWQVEGRDDPSFSTYRRLDLAYCENWSLWRDLRLLAATVVLVAQRAVRAVLARDGSRSARDPALVGESRLASASWFDVTDVRAPQIATRGSIEGDAPCA